MKNGCEETRMHRKGYAKSGVNRGYAYTARNRREKDEAFALSALKRTGLRFTSVITRRKVRGCA